MSIIILPFKEDHLTETRAFNARLLKNKISSKHNETHYTEHSSHKDQKYIQFLSFIALENEKKIRGGYVLKQQPYCIFSQPHTISFYQNPISEGLINNNYNLLGIRLLRHAKKKSPLLFALGMGGEKEKLPQLLKAHKWPLYKVPFFFKILNSDAFFKNIKALRKSVLCQHILNILQKTKFTNFLVTIINTNLFKKTNATNINHEVVEYFSDWSDEIWKNNSTCYSFIAIRNQNTLPEMYNKKVRPYIFIKVTKSGTPIGWLVLLSTQLDNHKQFGSMKLGTIVDLLCPPEYTKAIIEIACQVLSKKNVDLIISNQSSASVIQALKNENFIQGPSNFLFSPSKDLKKLLNKKHPFDITTAHINRGDGDGPIHL